MAVLEGLPELERKLKAMARVTQRALLVKATKKGAEVIRQAAEARAPRDTGNLAEEEIVASVSSETTATEAVVKIGPSKDAFYGLFQELGTAFMLAQPFLFPAFKEKKQEALQIVREELKTAVERVT